MILFSKRFANQHRQYNIPPMETFKCAEQHLSSSYNYKQQIEKQLISSLPSHIATVTQAGKVIRTATSILRLNLLECSLLSWLLRHSQYTLNNLNSSAHHISLFQEDQNKELLLLILLNAYYVKSFLNKEATPSIDLDIITMIPLFSKIYKNWRPDSLLKDASLSQINQTFNRWTLPPKRPKPDYNQYVNKILELSKTYNTANNEQQPPKKKRKPNQDAESAPRRQPIKEDKEEEQEQENEEEEVPQELGKSRNSMWLRSSRIHEPHQHYDQIFDYGDLNNDVPPSDLLRRSTRQRSGAYLNFDLENSQGNNLSGIFNLPQSMFRTNSRGLFTQQRGDKSSSINPHIRQTSSFDQVNE